MPTLTKTINPENTGTIDDVESGKTHELTATPIARYGFKDWTLSESSQTIFPAPADYTTFLTRSAPAGGDYTLSLTTGVSFSSPEGYTTKVSFPVDFSEGDDVEYEVRVKGYRYYSNNGQNNVYCGNKRFIDTGASFDWKVYKFKKADIGATTSTFYYSVTRPATNHGACWGYMEYVKKTVYTGGVTKTSNPLELTLSQNDISIQANFEYIGYGVDVQVNPEDYGTVTGSGYYPEGQEVTLTATPNLHKLFVNWTLNGVEVSTEPTYTFEMGSEDVTYVANFIDAPKYTITTSTTPSGVGSVYQSEKEVYQGENVTLRAREENGYSFTNWSNGSTSSPLTLQVDTNINISAIYTKTAKDNTYYQYRAYVKDVLNLNGLPKAFLVVRSFTIRRDLLTSSKSKFDCVEIPSNINEGDILALYDPFGKVMYYGVISSIDEQSLQCSQIQSFYKGQWIYETYPTTSLEAEISHILTRYAQGYQKDSTYRDMLVDQEKAPLRIVTEGTTSNQLETQDNKKQMDFEKFIYSLYESYNLIFDFEIPFNEWTIGSLTGGSVTIRKPINSIIKIGTNTESIRDMSPTTKIEQTNKLIVYGSNGTYRTTYIATTTNGVVQEPSSLVGRYSVVNTKVVYSDDDLNVIKEANISEDMFNHEITFTLLLDNHLYDFWSWELGQSLQIYDGSNYFDSVFTGYELSKSENQNPTEVKIICGKVRNKLTSLLKLGVAQ